MSEDILTDSHEDVMGVNDNGTFTALQDKIDFAEEGSTITLENDYCNVDDIQNHKID